MRFGLLGDLVATGDHGDVIAIRGARQRALLVLLLLHANQTVSADFLVEALWSGNDADTSAQALKMAVSRLRRTILGAHDGRDQDAHQPDVAERIATRGRGYLLNVLPGELDSIEFEHELDAARAALARGEHALALAQLRTALARWRGPALDEFRDHEWAKLEALRLEELRVEALEERIYAELALGKPRAVVAELEQLVAAHPERERLREHLMLALYRSGRQVEALVAFQDARRHLIDEYGVEPGERLRDLHQAILAQDPDLARGSERAVGQARSVLLQSGGGRRTALTSRLHVQSDFAFVGRGRERAFLEEALAAQDGSVRAVLISGEPGVGKTRLVSEFATSAHERGIAVAGGRCDSGLGLPYQPFVEILDDLLARVPSSVIEHHLAVHGLVLARIAPRLALGPPIQASSAHDGEGAHYRLFSAVADLLCAVARDASLLLVLEDLHWADEATVLLFKHLLTMPSPDVLTVLGTFRSTDLEGAPLGTLLPELHRERGVRRIALDGLGDADVIELVQEHRDEPLDADGQRIARRLRRDTAGNPFFLIQLLESGTALDARAPGAPVVKSSEQLLPVSLRETITARVNDLGDRAAEVLTVAAVAGDEFELALLRGLDLAPEQELLAAIEAGIAARLLLDASEPAGRLAFVHALVPHVLRSELTAPRRRALHRTIAAAMERLYGRQGDHIAALAHHWQAGCEPPSLEPALRCARLAAEQALDRLAPAEAARWYQDALELHAQQQGATSSERCELLISLGEAQRQAGDAAFRETLLEAARLAERLGDSRYLVRATLSNSRGFTSATGRIDTERVEMLRAALRSIDAADSCERAELLAAQAVELAFCGEREIPQQLSDEALAMACRCGDEAALVKVLTTRFFAIWIPDTLSIRLEESAMNVRLCEHLGNPLALAQALHWRANACIEGCDMVGARRCIDQVGQLSNRLKEPTVMWQAAYNDANLALALGQLDRAEQLALNALELGQRSGQPDALPVFAAQLANLRFDQGRLGELVPLIEQVLSEHAEITGFRALLALARCELQDREYATRAVAWEADRGFQDLAYDVTWLSVVCIYAHVCARLCARVPAATLYSMLEPWNNQVALSVVGWGCVAHYLGMLSTALGDFAAASEHFAHAAQVHEQMGAPVWSARTQLETARMLAARGRNGDRGLSRELAERALASARARGCETIARDAAAVLDATLMMT